MKMASSVFFASKMLIKSNRPAVATRFASSRTYFSGTSIENKYFKYRNGRLVLKYYMQLNDATSTTFYEPPMILRRVLNMTSHTLTTTKLRNGFTSVTVTFPGLMNLKEESDKLLIATYIAGFRKEHVETHFENNILLQKAWFGQSLWGHGVIFDTRFVLPKNIMNMYNFSDFETDVIHEGFVVLKVPKIKARGGNQ